MDNREQVSEIIKNLNDSTNKELQFCLDFLNFDFEQTKDAIIRLTKHLDTVEITYNKVLKEYESRNNVTNKA
jgi:hypothetical protein